MGFGTDILTLTVANAERRNPVKRGDVEGLDRKGRKAVFCGVCGEPKRVVLNFPDGNGGYAPRLVPLGCRCLRERVAAEQAAETERRRRELRGAGMVPPERTFDNSRRSAALDKCRRYAERWEEMRARNVGLLLWGVNGTGKTHAAHCVCNALLERNPPERVYATSVSRVLNAGYDKSGVMEDLRRASLAVLDDIGSERGNEYALESVFALIDERYRAGKPLIATTNLSVKELMNPLDPWRNPDIRRKRIYERILEMCVPIQFDGAPLRGKMAEENLAFVAAMLEGGGSDGE